MKPGTQKVSMETGCCFRTMIKLKWAMKNKLAESDPVYLADKPKRPHRIPVWLEKEEQATLQKAMRNIDDLPKNIFGRTREHIKGVRIRHDFLFGLILNSGLRISEVSRSGCVTCG